ncbi:MAG: hypothetical protein WC082_12235 [Victivallales bacterium]
MKKLVLLSALAAMVTVFVNGCCSNCRCQCDGVKSETCTKETRKTEHLVIE